MYEAKRKKFIKFIREKLHFFNSDSGISCSGGLFTIDTIFNILKFFVK
jgi:hypothetical protein